jgi:pimeloyl-ACP methyl ester carboxylesterase
VERLAAFRAAHHWRRQVIDGIEWTYLLGGQAEETIVLLPGGERIGDLGFTLVEVFKPQRRVLYPAYPPLATMRTLVDGLARLLDAEGIAQVTLLGASFGGDVAQVFVRAYPQRVQRLILANTGVPDARLGRLTARGMRLFSLAPMGMLRALIRTVLAKALTSRQSERAFWRAELAELCASLS